MNNAERDTIYEMCAELAKISNTKSGKKVKNNKKIKTFNKKEVN